MSDNASTTMNDATYTIAGSDGKNYGPVNAAQIREWIRQLRVDSRTPVFVNGTADWTFIGLLPEFAAEFAGHPPVITPPKPDFSATKKDNGFALWGMICGLLAWTLCGCCVPFAIAGLTLSIIGLVQINANDTTQSGRSLAIAGIVLSATNLAWTFGLTVCGFLNDPPAQFHLGN